MLLSDCWHLVEDIFIQELMDEILDTRRSFYFTPKGKSRMEDKVTNLRLKLKTRVGIVYPELKSKSFDFDIRCDRKSTLCFIREVK